MGAYEEGRGEVLNPYSKKDQLGDWKPGPKKITAKEFREKYSGVSKAASKSRVSNHKKLIKEADAWFSRRVRLEECNDRYLAKCVDCGRPWDVRRGDLGHFHSRKYNATRWTRENCGFQMKQHNRMMNDPVVHEGFKKELIRRHGKQKIEALEIQKNNFFKVDEFTLNVIIKENKEIAERLLKNKGLKKWW